MPRIPRRGTNYAARIRAARAYADLKRSELGSRINVSERQVTRLESGEATTDDRTRRAIAEACGVPADFMEFGFEPLVEPMSDPERRVRELLHQVEHDVVTAQALAARIQLHHIRPAANGDAVEADNLVVLDPQTHKLLAAFDDRLGQLEAAVGHLERDESSTPSGADERRRPPGALGRDARGLTPSDRRLEQADSDREPDDQRGSGEA